MLANSTVVTWITRASLDSNLAQLAVDVLKNTLTLPMDLITPNEDKPAAASELDSLPDAVPATP